MLSLTVATSASQTLAVPKNASGALFFFWDTALTTDLKDLGTGSTDQGINLGPARVYGPGSSH